MFSKINLNFSQDVQEHSQEKSQKEDDRVKQEAGGRKAEAEDADQTDISSESSLPPPTEEQKLILSLQAELEETRTKLAETHDKMLRIAADGDNTRKRLEKEKLDARRYGLTDFAKDLLPVMDAFEKALASLPTRQKPEGENASSENSDSPSENQGVENQKLNSISEGIELVAKAFHDALKKHGIERLPGKGAPFSPFYHNAIAKEVHSHLEHDTVLEEFVPGYKIGDRVLRTALVKVGGPE